MCNFWPKKWSRSLKKFEWWSLTRELLKQYLTEKPVVYEVVAYGRWSLTRGGRYERVDCSYNAPLLTILHYLQYSITYNTTVHTILYSDVDFL